MTRFCMFLLLCSVSVYAQKPVLNPTTYTDWETTIVDPLLTGDGKFALHTQRSSSGNQALLITDLRSNQVIKVDNLNSAVSLMAGDKMAAFKTTTDSLFIASFGQRMKLEKLDAVSTFSTNKADHLAYVSTSRPAELVLYQLNGKTKQRFSKVSAYFFSADGLFLYFKQQQDEPSRSERLMVLDLQTRKMKAILENVTIRTLVADSTGNQLLVAGSDKNKNRQIWYYKPTLDQVALLDFSKLTGKTTVDTIPPYFNRSRENLFFTLNNQTHGRPLTNVEPANMRIWSYRDSLFQSEIKISPPYSLFTFHIPTQQWFELANADEELIGTANGKWALVRKKFKTNRFWEEDLKADTYIVSLQTGEKVKLPEKFSNYESIPFFSPNRQFLINFHTPDLSYYVYDLQTGHSRNLSKQIKEAVYDDLIDRIVRRPYGVAGWYSEDQLLVYDQYDIWKVNVKEALPAQNITQGLGRKNKLIFSYVYEDRHAMVRKHPFMLLSAFDRETKNNGFWTLQANNAPVKRHMDARVYHISRVNSYGFEFPKGMKPIKAKAAEQYLVRRESATEHPNFFITADFSAYKPLSGLAPQRNYNWLTSEVISWTMTDGRPSQGILYKPENFDPQKKYPVIFHYYQRKSDKLNEYLVPQLSGATLDIPTYVSNGYLVFVPDIYYSFGKGNGESALNAVESAALFLKQFPFVDGTRMGLQAHSHGGSQTNFIIANSTLFAAACTVAGTANVISSYGQLTGRGASRQPGGEVGFMGIGFGVGKTPWSSPDLYIRNSPVFRIDKVTTPMLIMHGNKDTALPFEQSIELFTALRRAGKPAWFLEYLNAAHVLKDKQAEDFTVRMRQFFDHFLMNKPRPIWMK